MNREEFERLAAQGYNHIPVMRQVLADLETPLSVYLKLADAPYSFLLESVHGGEKWGRYSIIGLPCRTALKVYGRQVRVERDGQVIESAEPDDPLAWLDAYRARYRVPEVPGLPRFSGGLVGYFGYDAVRLIEPRLIGADQPDPLGTPDVLLLVSDEVVVFDNLRGTLYVVAYADAEMPAALEQAQRRLDELTVRMGAAPPPPPAGPALSEPPADIPFECGFPRAEFEAAVAQIKDYIVDGDVMQVVLSQRLGMPYRAAPLDLYRALRTLNPSPYMYFFNLGGFHVVGSSPEILVRLEDEQITVRPIAGTRPRGRTEEADQALEQALLADPKERAEHLMLIDLGRNDVGRVAAVGSVQVTEQMGVERYSHVMHIVSNVHGRLRAGLGPMDVLRATFPAGTLTGAPKVRAMEIIDELEPVKRGVYSGAVGYVGWTGNMDTAIAIRTAIIKEGRLYIQAGAGVVADSDPVQEWQETLSKGQAVLKAAAMADAGRA